MHAEKHQSFYKLTLSFLWKWPDMSIVPEESWQYFCNLLRKKSRNCFCVLLRCKTFIYFPGVQPYHLFLSDTRFSVVATLFDVASCIFKLKGFKCSNSFMLYPIIKLGHYIIIKTGHSLTFGKREAMHTRI